MASTKVYDCPLVPAQVPHSCSTRVALFSKRLNCLVPLSRWQCLLEQACGRHQVEILPSASNFERPV